MSKINAYKNFLVFGFLSIILMYEALSNTKHINYNPILFNNLHTEFIYIFVGLSLIFIFISIYHVVQYFLIKNRNNED